MEMLGRKGGVWLWIHIEAIRKFELYASPRNQALHSGFNMPDYRKSLLLSCNVPGLHCILCSILAPEIMPIHQPPCSPVCGPIQATIVGVPKVEALMNVVLLRIAQTWTS